MRFFTTAACFLTALSSALAQAKRDNSAGIQWAAKWDEALEESQARNAPIMFTVHKDD